MPCRLPHATATNQVQAGSQAIIHPCQLNPLHSSVFWLVNVSCKGWSPLASSGRVTAPLQTTPPALTPLAPKLDWQGTSLNCHTFTWENVFSLTWSAVLLIHRWASFYSWLHSAVCGCLISCLRSRGPSVQIITSRAPWHMNNSNAKEACTGCLITYFNC